MDMFDWIHQAARSMQNSAGMSPAAPAPTSSPSAIAAPMTDAFGSFHDGNIQKAINDYRAKAGQAIAANAKTPAAPTWNDGMTVPGAMNAILPKRAAPSAAPSLTTNPSTAIDTAATQIGDSATKSSQRLDEIFKALNALKNPWDVNGGTFQSALGRNIDDVTRAGAGSQQRTLDTLAQRGQTGIGASIAAAQMGRQQQQALSDAQSGMQKAALEGTADFEMRKADALSRLAGGDLSGTLGAYGQLANLGLSVDGQKFSQKLGQGAEDRAQGRYGLELKGLAASVGMQEGQLYEQLQGMPSRIAQLDQAVAGGQLSLAQAKAKFPFEIKLLENQLAGQGLQLDEQKWAADRRDLVLGLNFISGIVGAAAPVAAAAAIPGAVAAKAAAGGK